MRSLVLVITLAACKTEGPDPAPEPVVVRGSGVRACGEPGLRSADGHFTRKSAPEQPIPAAFLAGGGLAVEDLDGDGHLDLFLPSEQTAQLWFGDGAGEFVDAAATSLAGLDLTMAVGATPVDVDGDGDLDLFVTRWERPNALLRNDGHRTFTDITAASGLGNTAWRTQSASWADIDLDGDLDLFVGSYGTTPDTYDDPSMDPADPSELYRNDGDGTFTDISHLLPPEVHDGYTFSSGWYDLDDDGYPELISAHDFGKVRQSVLLDNLSGEAFAVDLGSAFHPDAEDMGMGVGDLNGDELPDFVFTSWRRAFLLESTPVPASVAPNGVMYVDNTNARGLTVKYETGTAQQVYGWGAELADVDNDADLDAVMVFGFWSAYTGAGDPLKQFDGLWLQDEAGQFSNHAPGAEWQLNDPGISRGLVLADLNDDGWLDVVKRQLDGDTLMYLSRCGAESWARVRLQAPGPNTRGVGAKVRLTAGGRTQVRWITTGSTGMYSGAPLEAHFGLGAADRIDRLEVVWPDMRVDVFEDLDARQVLTVTRR